ncbi:nucleolar protein 14 [Ochotona princeps]|uniref:nucleolar protein 14 n=1 Tax=Ochotona princeps TaxID=9978 RepID=UPI002714E597|nr:nucleolar protein 14 [Ochotona princeps]
MGKARPAAARAGPAQAKGKANPNPFEVKVNRQKFQVLGRRTRHDVGLPGVSRARALKKRTQTLLKEYKERDKSSVFLDKRFGEYEHSMSAEDKMLRRFALEQQKHHEKKSIYNLNEDEELTHYGQSLADIENHNDTVDSDSDTEERGTLSAELTAAHFGGGAGQHHGQEGAEGEQPAKSRKELIEELIARSKQEKRERQAQREDALELTEKLDQDWKVIRALLARKAPRPEAREPEKPKPDAYDVMVRELGFEMKAQPSSRMKSEAELAREAQAQLQRLEAERLRRMRGQDGEDGRRPEHSSADDLNDGFVLTKDDRRLLSYRDGKMDVEEAEQTQAADGSEEAGEGAESSGEDSESDGPDSHSDLESDAESDGDQKPQGESRQACGLRPPSRDRGAAATELPYTFAAPTCYEDLKSLLSGRSPEEQSLVVERIQKCNHPSLAVGNKAKLEKLFGFLLEYVGDLAASDPPGLRVVDKLVVQLYSLCQMFPASASSSVRFVLRDAMHEMEAAVESKGRAAFPGLDVLIYLKIAGMLFPTSDFRHPVVTPALVCMSQLLTKCRVLSLQDVVKGLFVCGMFLEYVSLSQRFIPELINFLLGILHMATPNQPSPGYTLVHPFRALGRSSELLLVSAQEDVATWQRSGLPLHWAAGPRGQTKVEANHARLSCLAVGLALLKHALLLYRELPAFPAITQPLRALLTQHLAACSQPLELQEQAQSLLADLEARRQLLRPLTYEKTKPEPLKLFTPRLVKVLEFGRKQGSSKEEQERKRLIHKHKREFKGAVREIRKDNQFLARMQLSEIMERDAERKRQVKRLLGSLATQEGEWKALKRKKHRR